MESKHFFKKLFDLKKFHPYIHQSTTHNWKIILAQILKSNQQERPFCRNHCFFKPNSLDLGLFTRNVLVIVHWTKKHLFLAIAI